MKVSCQKRCLRNGRRIFGKTKRFITSQIVKFLNREQIYEKFVSIVTLEHLLRKDLETFFASSSDWVLRPKLSSEQVLQTLPDLLRTKPDQEYTNYLNESYLLYLQNASVDEKNVGALNQLQLSMQRTCNTLLERVEEFLEQDNNNDNKPISSTDKSLEKTVEKSLSWLAYEKGSGLT